MANVINPVTVGVQHSGKNTDQSVFDATQFAGMEWSIDGKPAVSTPMAFAADGKYQMPVGTNFDSLTNGTHTAAFRLVNKTGNRSALSPAGSFDVDRRTPEAPFGVSFA